MVMTAGEVGTLFGEVGLLTGTVTVQQWDGDSWIAVSGWTAQAVTISGKGVEKAAHVPAGQTTRPNLSTPLRAMVSSPGVSSGPYACRFVDDVGSQALVWRVGLHLLGNSGGDQWEVLQERDNGITVAAPLELGVVTAYKAPPDEPVLRTSEGDILVQRDKDVMLIPPPADVELQQGLILRSVAVPTLRFRIMTLDLVDLLDDTNYPGYLEVTLEPA